MTQRLEIYKCNVCGNIVAVLHAGDGKLVCCGQPMLLQEAGVTDGAMEKHVPVVEKKDNGYLVKVGAQPHPMIDVHYIEWIEIITEDRVYRKFLKPNEQPEAFFEGVNADHFIIREYCNIHGLWKSEK